MSTIKIFTGNSNPAFSKKVSQHLGIPLGQSEVSRFADGEVQVYITENIRDQNVFIIQSTCPPVNENYMELFILVDAIKRASAKTITLVMPYYGYARQDRRIHPHRSSISASCMAHLCQSVGIDKLLVVDLHSPQIQGFFNIPVDNIFASTTLANQWLKTHPDTTNIVCISPDAGSVERTTTFAKKINNTPIAVIDKRRSKPNEAKVFNLIGDVKGKTALIIDDMIDTAGTLCAASDYLTKYGAKEVYAIVTHGVFSGSAIQKINNSSLKTCWITDTIPLKIKSPKIHCVSVAPLVAEAINRIHSKGSLSNLWD